MPLNEPFRSKWISAIEESQPFDYVVQTYHVCSLHFHHDDIMTKGKRKTVKCGKVPSIFPTDANYSSNGNLPNSNIQSGVAIGSSNTISLDQAKEATTENTQSTIEAGCCETEDTHDAAILVIGTSGASTDSSNDMQYEPNEIDSCEVFHENDSNISTASDSNRHM